MFEPAIDRAQWFGIQLVHAESAFAALIDEMGAAKQAKMFGNGWPGDGELLRDSSGGLAATAQKVEHSPAGRIGECIEGRF